MAQAHFATLVIIAFRLETISGTQLNIHKRFTHQWNHDVAQAVSTAATPARRDEGKDINRVGASKKAIRTKPINLDMDGVTSREQHKALDKVVLPGERWLVKDLTVPAFDEMLREPMGMLGRRAKEAPLDDAGYLSVVKLEDSHQMEIYVRRIITDLGLYVRDEGALGGMVPHFSGKLASQSFFALKMELLSAAALDHSWLAERNVTNASVTERISQWKGSTAPLNEAGYASLVKRKSFKDMKMFMLRIVRDLNLFVSQEGPFNGMVPYYSGERGSQTYARLRSEIIGAVRIPDGWFSSGSGAVLSESGYNSVASLKNDTEMAVFTQRVAEHLGCRIVDGGGLYGMVPYFSGNISVQSLWDMKEVLRKECDLSGSNKKYGSMHDVVGKDGVWQIRLDGSSRFKFSAEELRSASVQATPFAATDAQSASETDLRASCPLASEAETKDTCSRKHEEVGADLDWGENPGCQSKVEQAITDSHKRALLAAQARNGSDWTAIIEDDIVPLHPGYFDSAFRKVWNKVPMDAKMVRLSWCSFEQDLGSIRKLTYADAGEFRLVRTMSWRDDNGNPHYYAGGCTTGYMVHRSFIPELLSMFPCCCPIDCCMERQLFYTHTKPDPIPGAYRGQQVMINMDAWDSREDSYNYTSFFQGGVFVQDSRNLDMLHQQQSPTATEAKRIDADEAEMSRLMKNAEQTMKSLVGAGMS